MQNQTSKTSPPTTSLWAQLRSYIGCLDIKVAIKTGVAAALGWSLGLGTSSFMHRHDRLISGLWCTVAAIVVLQTRLGGTYKAAWLRFLGVIIGSFFGGLCTTFLGSNPLSLGVSVFFTIILCTLFNFKESLRIACLSVCVVMVLWGLSPTISPWTFAFFRIIDSILGILVGVIVAHSLWPFQATQNMQQNISQILSCLNQIMQVIGGSEPKKLENIEYEELTENLNKLFKENALFLEEAKMELLTKPERLDVWSSLHEHLEALFEFIVALKNIVQHPSKLMDEPLKVQLNQVNFSLDAAFKELSKALISGQEVPSLSLLTDAQNKLEEELLRFRKARSTRPFNLYEVEGFFVFFYNLRFIVQEVFKIAKKINELNQ